jgi:hypothetical protein
MSILRKSQKQIWPFVLGFAFLWFWSQVAAYFGPRLEGELFPVALATNVQVSNLGENKSGLSGNMVKYRQCDFLSMEGYVFNPVTGQEVVAPIDVLENIKLRPKGEFAWGPWVVTFPIWQVSPTRKFQVVTYHRCHPFWVTETVFWRSE